MKKIHHCLLIGSFCLFLILLPVSGALFRIVSGPAQSDENRPLKAFPPIRTTDDLDAFPDRFSDWFGDHLFWKKQLVAAKSGLELMFFRELDSEKVIAGTQKPWLFNRSDDGQPLETYKHMNLFDERALQEISDNLNQLAEEAGAFDIRLILLIAPDKEQVYGDRFMPSRFKVQGQTSRTEQLIARLSETSPAIPVIYPLDKLSDWSLQNETYYTSDTHWNLSGAYIAAGKLTECIAALTGGKGAVVPHSFSRGSEKTGDLQRLAQLGPDWNSIEAEPAESLQKTVLNERTDRNGETIRETGESTFTDPVPVKIYFTGDSFRWNLTPFLEENFRESVITSRYYFDPEDLIAEAPDILVYEIAERYLHELSLIPGYNTMALQP